MLTYDNLAPTQKSLLLFSSYYPICAHGQGLPTVNTGIYTVWSWPSLYSFPIPTVFCLEDDRPWAEHGLWTRWTKEGMMMANRCIPYVTQGPFPSFSTCSCEWNGATLHLRITAQFDVESVSTIRHGCGSWQLLACFPCLSSSVSLIHPKTLPGFHLFALWDRIQALFLSCQSWWLWQLP